MDRSLRLGAAQMETTETGDLVSRVAEDAREISQAATAVMRAVTRERGVGSRGGAHAPPATGGVGGDGVARVGLAHAAFLSRGSTTG